MKAVVAAFNQEKALVGAFSVIVQLHRLIDLRHYSLPTWWFLWSLSKLAAMMGMGRERTSTPDTAHRVPTSLPRPGGIKIVHHITLQDLT